MNNNKKYDINECSSRGVCSISPTVAAMQEIILLFLGQSAYYILQLEKFGGNNKSMLIKLFNDIASLNAVNVISEKQFYDILIRNYFLLNEVKNIYIKYCTENNIAAKQIDLPFEFNENLVFSKVISLGEKLSLNNHRKLSQNQKNLTDILFVIIKSICQNLTYLNDYNVFIKEGYQEVLQGLNILNRTNITKLSLQKNIKSLALLDNKITKLLSQNIFEKFGTISKVEVSRSTRAGKAILVSGSNFNDLYRVLEITKDKNIDVYTHSNLLIAHSLNKFREFENLVGHYGNDTESCIVDYGTFPGAILLTKGERNNSEYLYRGRLFSNDYFTTSGVIKIENGDYTPVLDAAENAKGFSKGKNKEFAITGFNELDIEKAFEQIKEKLDKGEIKHLYIIGLNAHSEKQKEYFNEFFEHLKKDEYAVSFYYSKQSDNVLTINIGNYAPLAAYLLSKLFENREIGKNITFIYTTCDVTTISGIVMLKMRGANNIYMANCPPTVLNPSVFETFLNIYNVKITQSAVQDLHDMRL